MTSMNLKDEYNYKQLTIDSQKNQIRNLEIEVSKLKYHVKLLRNRLETCNCKKEFLCDDCHNLLIVTEYIY